MKVLTINSSDLEGGAARAAYRLHQGLIRVGVRSELYVQSRSTDDPHVNGPCTPFGKAVAKVRPSLDMRPVRKYPNYRRKMFSPAWLPSSGLVDRINSSDADIVHLHWVNGGMVRVEDLRRIVKPMVWSMHDMWPFTGGCHYDEGCGRFKRHCGSCPILGSARERDLSHRVFDRKARSLGGMLPITFIGLSHWMADEARSSALLKGHEVVSLPNPIDTDVFKPVDRRVAREMLGLPQDRPVVLFGAINATADPRKGFEHLRAALREIPGGTVELAIFGAGRPAVPADLGHPEHYMGRLNDDLSLCLLYNAADVTVVPSVQENLSNTIVESLACGSPAVAFNIGGNRDMIEHRVNGYLAKPFDPQDLAKGIMTVIDPGNSAPFREQARALALDRFELERVANRYRDLYQQVIAQRPVRA